MRESVVTVSSDWFGVGARADRLSALLSFGDAVGSHMAVSFHDLVDRGDKLGPGAGAPIEGGEPGRSDGIDLPLPRVAFFLPLARDQAFPLQGMQGRVQRAFFELQRVAAAPLDLP